MRGAAWVCTVLAVAAALAGCFGPDDGPDTVTIDEGDFVRIHYVARYASNGTVVESSYNGTWPADTEFSEVPFDEHLPKQFWVYAWHPDAVENRTGRDELVRTAFRDLDGDGFRESQLKVIADLVQNEGTVQRENRNLSLWDVPGDVLGDPNIMVEGIYRTLVGREIPEDRLRTKEGIVVEDLRLPPEEAYGEVQDRLIENVSRVLEDQSRNLTVATDRAREESNMTNETEEGDLLAYEVANGTIWDATVVNLTQQQVELYLHPVENDTVPWPFRNPLVPSFWPARVTNVTEGTFDLYHLPTVDRTYSYTARTRQGPREISFRITQVNATEMTFDRNDPRAGHEIVFDLKVIDVAEPPGDDALLRGETVDPFKVNRTLRDVAMVSRSTAVVGTTNGPFVSFRDDEFQLGIGRTWFPYKRDLAGQAIHDVTVGATEAGEVWLAADNGVWHTTTNGFNWSRPEDRFDGSVLAVAPSPTDPSVVYALVEGEGVFRSTDRGATWSGPADALTQARALAVDTEDPDILWAATGSGLRRSDDRGGSWSVAAFDGESVTDVGLLDGRSIYAVVDGQFQLSGDRGGSWSEGGGAGSNMTWAAHAPDDPQRMIGGNPDNTLVFSRTAGQLWLSQR